MKKVLLVDDDRAVREALGQSLDLAGLAPILAGSFVEAKDHLSPSFDGIIVSDIRMPGRDGFHLLGHARGVDRDLPVIMLTGEGDIPMAVRAMGEGAFDFLEKPCAPSELVATINRALQQRKTVLEARATAAKAEAGDAASRVLRGSSQLAMNLRNAARQAAGSGRDVLIEGAPGSGTSKVAEVIHLLSDRQAAPFRKVAARDLDAKSLATALEGDGTLFIDEISRLGASEQYDLYDLLRREGRPVLIAGTTQPLGPSAEAGEFNQDLHFTLNSGQIRIPALRERPEDIPILFRHYVGLAAEQGGLTPPEITPEHLAALMARPWPGNARALMSEAMRFAMGGAAITESTQGLTEQLAQVEKTILEETLRRYRGRAAQVAEALKLPRKTLYDRLARHGLRPEDFRA
ncbi:MAG: sigma-54 dependent transcriptional regulator [Pseudomonadota bacterium]